MSLLVYLINLAVNIYVTIIVVQVAVSWLISFEVINVNNEKAKNLVDLLKRATDPVYKPVQKFVPPIGGIDLTPLVVIVGLMVVANILTRLLYGALFY